MCGKFTQLATWAEVVAFSQPLIVHDGDGRILATPMRFAWIQHLGPDGARTMRAMRWGFPDRNAKSPGRPKHMHARAETIDTLPTFAESFRERRGVLYVATFNEGEELPNGKTKQWTITPNDGERIAIAVIFEEWVNGDERLFNFIQVTTAANALITPITDRMPAILRPEHIPLWLGKTSQDPAEIKAALQTFEDHGAWSIAPEHKPKPAGPAGQAELF